MRTAAAVAIAIGLPIVAVASAPRVARAGGTCTPPRVMVVLDKSSSMQTGTIAGHTKWSIAVDALGTVLTELDGSAEVGLMTFPQPNACGPGTLDVAPALGTRTAILGELSSPPPTAGNWTPMAQTLDAAAGEPSMTATDTPRYVVLISDGWQWCSPYDPATRFDGVDAVTQLNAAGVTTFLVGFGGATDAMAMTAMAVEAGTARPGCDTSNDEPSDPNSCYYQADNEAELVAALLEIADVVDDELCDGLDNDCDGEVDEGLVQGCATACGAGTETCVAGTWTDCDAPVPAAEVCDGADNDCDGTADPGCECLVGETRPCGETADEGACAPGTQTCGADGTWGDCDGSVGPGNEMCNAVDDDCDGETDEAMGGGDDVGIGLCPPGEACVDGDCAPVDPVFPEAEDEEPEIGTPAGCGCATGGSDGAAGLVLMLGAVVVALRRRRGI